MGPDDRRLDRCDEPFIWITPRNLLEAYFELSDVLPPDHQDIRRCHFFWLILKRNSPRIEINQLGIQVCVLPELAFVNKSNFLPEFMRARYPSTPCENDATL